MSRDQILDALTGPGSDRSDRSIDYLINRLRHKLSDDARNPRFIATRYGEGYVWIAPPAGIDPGLGGACIIVGPVRGIDTLTCSPEPAERFARELCAALRFRLPPQRRVVLAPDCPPPSAFGDAMPSLSIELICFEECGAVSCVASAREFRSGRMLWVRRVTILADRPAEIMQSAAGLAKLLLAGCEAPSPARFATERARIEA